MSSSRTAASAASAGPSSQSGSRSSSPTPSNGDGPQAAAVTAGLSFQDLTEIRRVSEELNPGVSTRVSAADYESIVLATLTKTGIPLPRRVRYTPAPSVATELVSALGSLSRAYADVLASPPKKAVPPIVVGVAGPSGVRAGAKVEAAKPKGKAPRPTPPEKAGTSGPPPAQKAGASSSPDFEKVRKRLRVKSLRAFDSKSWAHVIHECKLTREKVISRIASLTEREILASDTSLPPLVRIGLITLEEVAEAAGSSWSDEVENDAELQALINRALAVKKAAEAKLQPPRQPQSKDLSILRSFREGLAKGRKVVSHLTSTARLERFDLEKPWLLAGITDHIFSEDSLKCLAEDTGVLPSELPSRIRIHCSPLCEKENVGTKSIVRTDVSVVGVKGSKFTVFVVLAGRVAPGAEILSYICPDKASAVERLSLNPSTWKAGTEWIRDLTTIWPVSVQTQGVGDELVSGAANADSLATTKSVGVGPSSSMRKSGPAPSDAQGKSNSTGVATRSRASGPPKDKK